MARGNAKWSVQKLRRQTQGARHQEIDKRRSARLQRTQGNVQPKHLLPSPPGTDLPKAKSILPQPSSTPLDLETVSPSCPPYKLEAKRKRLQEDKTSQDGPLEKRPRISSDWADTGKRGDIIDHWCREGNWPKKYFEQGNQTWLEVLEANRKQAVNMDDLAQPVLVKRTSSVSLRRENLELGIKPSSDLLREEKSAKYMNPEYTEELKNRGDSYMYESALGVTDKNKEICQDLLNSAQTVVSDSIFSDSRFYKACENLQDRNEAKVIQDITRLIVPSAETLAICSTENLATNGDTGVKDLIESVNEGWNKIIPITDTRPQPDYSVGFQGSAFTNEQLLKLKVLCGGSTELSRFMATWRMYFPFLTCEVKCGAVALDIADRQNAHSMTCAVKSIVELYRYVKLDEEELNRELLGFSISHDDKVVRIYGHYPVLEGGSTTFYRHIIHKFDFQALEGKERWTSYKFTKNVYEKWMPTHLKRISRAIDALPFNFGVLSSSRIDSTPTLPTTVSPEETAQTPLSSQGTENSKRARLKPTVMLQQENDWLKQQLAQERDESKRRHEEVREENQKLLQQLAQEREDSKRRHEEAKEENQKLMQQLALERDESKRRHEEAKEEAKEENQKLLQQLAQERDESKHRHAELMDLLRQQKTR